MANLNFAVLVLLIILIIYFLRNQTLLASLGVVSLVVIAKSSGYIGGGTECNICYSSPDDDDWSGWASEKEDICNECSKKLLFFHKGEKMDNIIQYKSYDDICGPFYHERQRDGATCTIYAVNNMFGRHVVDHSDLKRIYNFIQTEKTRQWMQEQIEKYKNSKLTDATKRLMRSGEGFLYNLDYPLINELNKDDLNYAYLDFVMQILIASFVIDGGKLTFRPMLIVHTSELANYSNVDRVIINSDTECTGSPFGHAVAARKIRKNNCSDFKYDWVIINSLADHQKEVNLLEEYKKCIVAFPHPDYPTASLSS